jgi:hypothetical protein
MAMFRQHISVGAIVSIIGVVMVFFYGLLTDPILLLVMFVLGTLGSFLPDVDSDSGLPFYLLFGATTVAFAGLALYILLGRHETNYYILAGVPIAAIAIFWFVVGGIFKHITHHRGIWHSIPAMAIAAAATYVVSIYLGMGEYVSLLFGGAIAAGFASHLILDEVYADVNMDGTPFTHKHSLGSALKLFSNSNKVNLLAYLLLGGLLYMALHPSLI